MSFGFDLKSVEVEGGRSPLPAGEYIAEIKKLETRTSKANAENKYINVMYKLCGNPKLNGAVVFDMVNTHNLNETAQNIGRSRLKSMILAAGSAPEEVNDKGPDFLIGKKVSITVTIESDDRNEKRNRVINVSQVTDKQRQADSIIGDKSNAFGF